MLTPDTSTSSRLFDVIGALEHWLRARDYAGKDPFDALNATRMPAVVRSNHRLRQVAIQFGKRSPVDVRPLLGVPQVRIAKGVGLVASGYAFLHDAGWDGPAHARGLALLDWLAAQRRITRDDRAWGYEFDVQTRWAYYPRGTPNIIVTTFVANAFLDWYERDGESAHLEIVRQAVDFLVEELLVSDADQPYFAYVPGVATLVHNANVLGCGLLARFGAIDGDASLIALALQAARTTVVAQDSRGFWPYGRGSNLAWVDGLHTAYVLGGLHDLWRATDDDDVHGCLTRGMGAYITELFSTGAVPKFTDLRQYPVDIHCASSAIELFVRAREVDDRCWDQSWNVARWTITNLRDPAGFFYFQKNRWYTNRIPYVRWSQAHMLKALAALAGASKP